MSGFKKGLKDGIPIALGYLSVSFTFGLQGVKGGLSWWETVLISICNVTSAGQFAGLDIMLSGGGFWIEMACALTFLLTEKPPTRLCPIPLKQWEICL